MIRYLVEGGSTVIVKSSVDPDAGASDITGGFGQQEGYCSGYLGFVSVPLHGYVIPDISQYLMGVFRVGIETR